MFAVKVKANWSNEVANFDYTGTVQTYTAPADGYYKLEVWGASGNSANYGGNGGYSVGIFRLSRNNSFYLVVGGTTNSYSGGYNGGGTGGSAGRAGASGGGGATHIADSTGLLSTFENKRNSLIIVAGGGGGGDIWPISSPVSSYPNAAVGGSGGGISGGYGLQTNSNIQHATGGTQSQGGTKGTTANYETVSETGSFGTGGAANLNWGGGGGGGYFGGGPGGADGPWCSGGGGGSGYIGNSSLISGAGITKHMYGYNVPTSNDANIRTITGTCANATPTADCAKIGNGYARITYLGSTI